MAYSSFCEAELDGMAEEEKERGLSVTWCLWSVEAIDPNSGKGVELVVPLPFLRFAGYVVLISLAATGTVGYREPTYRQEHIQCAG
jgi:hypothetical protein